MSGSVNIESSNSRDVQPLDSQIDLFAVILNQEHAWTKSDIGKNGISNLLGDIGVSCNATGSGLNPLKPSRELPVQYVPSTNIRKVRETDFEFYLQHIQPVYSKYLYSKAIGVQKAVQGVPELAAFLNKTDLDKENADINLLIKKHLPNYKVSSSPVADNEPNAKLPHILSQKDRQIQKRLMKENLKPLESIPKHFFQEDFQLMLPSTVDLVTDSTDLNQLFGSLVARLRQNEVCEETLLQKNINAYLETAESHLINEISQKSHFFFNALQNLESLNQEASLCVEQIAALRTKLQNVSTLSSKQGLEIVRIKQKRNNLSLLHNSIKLIQDLKQTQPMIQVLLGQGDYSGALDLIEEASRLFRIGADLSVLGASIPKPFFTGDSTVTSPNSSVQMLPQIFFDQAPGSTCVVQIQSVKALLHFTGQLREVAKNVGLLMEADFVHAIMNDLQETIRLGGTDQEKIAPKCRGTLIEDWVQAFLSHAPVVPGLINNKVLVSSEEESRLKSRMQPLVSGLIRLDTLASALHVYTEKARREVNAAIKKNYPAINLSQHEKSLSAVSNEGLQPVSSKGSSYQRSRTLSITSSGHPATMSSGASISNLNGTLSTANSSFAGLTPLARYLKLQIKPQEFLELLTSLVVVLTQLLGRAAAIHYTIVAIAEDTQRKRAENPSRQLQLMQDKASALDVGASAATSVSAVDDEDDELGAIEIGVGAGKTIVAPAINEASAESTNLKDVVARESLQALSTISEECFMRLAKILALRLEQNAALEQIEFISLYNVVNEFCRISETLCSKPLSSTLRSVLLATSKKYFARFHEARLQQLAQSIETECWAATSVTTTMQELADLLLELKEHNLQWSLVFNRSASFDSTAFVVPSDSNKDDSPAEKKINLLSQSFFVVQTTLTFLKIIWDYSVSFQLLNNSIGTEILCRLMDCMKVYNSRICQVILGAGALKSVGLKNITTKHIVLAAQSLSSIVLVMTHLRSFFGRHLSVRQQNLLNDFDKICKDFVDHENELFGRLVRLMEDRLALNLTEAMLINWNSAETSGQSPHSYALAVVKDTSTLCKVLLKYLSSDRVNQIMGQTFLIYYKRFEDTVPKLHITSIAGKMSVHEDLSYISKELSPLYSLEVGSNGTTSCMSKLAKLSDSIVVTPTATVPAASAQVKEGKQGYFSSLFSGKNNSSKSVIGHRGLNQTIQIASSPVSSTSVNAPSLSASALNAKNPPSFGSSPVANFGTATAANMSSVALPESMQKSQTLNVNSSTLSDSETLKLIDLAASQPALSDGDKSELDLDLFLNFNSDVSQDFIERLSSAANVHSHFIDEYEQRKQLEKQGIGKTSSDESFKLPERLPSDANIVSDLTNKLLAHYSHEK